MDQEEIQALMVLSLTRGMGPTLIRRAVACLGSPENVLAAAAGDLARVRGIGPRRSEEIRRGIDAVLSGDALRREQQAIAESDTTLLATSDPRYPRLLLHIPDAPPLLYVNGVWHEDDAVAIAIVGARRCTQYGRGQADRLAGLCAETGLCVVSGGAYGIDAAAHEAALRHGGRTIAVLGSGLARPYPSEHAVLFDRIADGRGVVVSELPMAAPPMAEHFPRRNRIISGLALGVLVIEAALRSGALLTARLAAEEHGREVLAVPGRVDSATSAGCHRMIREGWAALVTDMADVLEALGETGQLLRAGGSGQETAPRRNPVLSPSQRVIVAALDRPCSADEIAAGTGLTVGAIQADLTMLEIRGVLRKQGPRFERCGG